jgi:hypothetical protein
VLLDLNRCFPFNGLRRPLRAAPLFSLCGSAPSRRAAASRALSSDRSTPAHTANSHAPPRACLRHSLGTTHEPLLCRCSARLLPHPRAWATPRVTAHSGLLASARVSHLLCSYASCTPLLARGRSHLAYPCRNHTLPHRFPSARVPPRRELRPSAAWFACRSRVCSTPPTRPCSARANRSEPLCRQPFAILLRPSPASSPGSVSVLQHHHAPLLGSAGSAHTSRAAPARCAYSCCATNRSPHSCPVPPVRSPLLRRAAEPT